MTTILIAVASFFGFIVAYHSYGRWLARKIFSLNPVTPTPSHTLADGKDYVATKPAVLFGHHFSSIAGTGPIVGPAIAVLWGWLPALLWVVFGSIFVGAVHDFGTLVVSIRHRGQSIGDVSGKMVSKRCRLLFLSILFFTLTLVVAVFGLVIATLFSIYPESVFSVWFAMPLAVVIGLLIYKTKLPLAIPSIIALFLLYFTVYLGVYHLPLSLPFPLFPGEGASLMESLHSSVGFWTVFILLYCFIASVLPVWLLLQPRDYISALQLYVALGALMAGLFVAAPPIVTKVVGSAGAGAPPIMPFLFITIACGAVSGFHSVVSSGTSSKQIDRESDAHFIGYGSMLVEAMLAILVIFSCVAGIGMLVKVDGETLTGSAAFLHYYGVGWDKMSLAQTIAVFVQGAGNLIASLGIPRELACGVVAVMIAGFAMTSIDTSTRLNRYVIQEIGSAVNVKALGNKYVATLVAVGTAAVLAFMPGPQGPGSGGLLLWPLFGATNQLLAGLALMVVIFYLRWVKKPVFFAVLPLILMLVMPAWAIVLQLADFWAKQNYLLVGFSIAILLLQIWMLIEAVIAWRTVPQRAAAEAQSMDAAASSADRVSA
ncbi:MAG: carbon starvation protein A [Candidatus Hydrogenedentes bacterium]|jgi:carbon starvation protein|nr:carbon starvation protein A [Candidatus Hydrogenedentota bacterium]